MTCVAMFHESNGVWGGVLAIHIRAFICIVFLDDGDVFKRHSGLVEASSVSFPQSPVVEHH